MWIKSDYRWDCADRVRTFDDSFHDQLVADV